MVVAKRMRGSLPPPRPRIKGRNIINQRRVHQIRDASLTSCRPINLNSRSAPGVVWVVYPLAMMLSLAFIKWTHWLLTEALEMSIVAMVTIIWANVNTPSRYEIILLAQIRGILQTHPALIHTTPVATLRVVRGFVRPGWREPWRN